MSHLATRRRTLAAKGRQMSLSRPNGSPPADAVALQGYLVMFAPDRIVAPVHQGDANVSVLNDEISAAMWPGPPGAGDYIEIDGAIWAVLGANPVYDGPTLVGFNLWCRGGDP